MSRLRLKATAKRLSLRHGNDSRFQPAYCGRTQGQNARQMLAALSNRTGNTEIAVSVVSLIELAHGAARADTVERRTKRQRFIEELLLALPVHPITVSVALRTGQIDGENLAKGVRLPLADLLIGVTAS